VANRKKVRKAKSWRSTAVNSKKVVLKIGFLGTLTGIFLIYVGFHLMALWCLIATKAVPESSINDYAALIFTGRLDLIPALYQDMGPWFLIMITTTAVLFSLWDSVMRSHKTVLDEHGITNNYELCIFPFCIYRSSLFVPWEKVTATASLNGKYGRMAGFVIYYTKENGKKGEAPIHSFETNWETALVYTANKVHDDPPADWQRVIDAEERWNRPCDDEEDDRAEAEDGSSEYRRPAWFSVLLFIARPMSKKFFKKRGMLFWLLFFLLPVWLVINAATILGGGYPPRPRPAISAPANAVKNEAPTGAFTDSTASGALGSSAAEEDRAITP